MKVIHDAMLEKCSVDDFAALMTESRQPQNLKFTSDVDSYVPIYDAVQVEELIEDPVRLTELSGELNWIFSEGPGIVAFRNAYRDKQLIDDVTEVFNGIIEEEEKGAKQQGDHFAETGANSRVWNAHEKLCIAAPELYISYYTNSIIALASTSWLGPAYQITAQVNVVRPGGRAQICHRDYHMGFLPGQRLTEYPINAHCLSASLTLQGAVAHSDMPVESGPTKLLPYSQKYDLGYLAVLRPEFRNYFEENYVQLSLEKGDAVFFNPAVFHAAGDNKTSHIHRFANLMQIGSAFGRSIEIVNRARICMSIYEPLTAMMADNKLSALDVENVIAASAEGYPFPTDLDRESPTDSMVPVSQQDLMHKALEEGWTRSQLEISLAEAAN